MTQAQIDSHKLGGDAGVAGAARGFSLIELAVVLFIVALLLGSIMVPLKTQVESRNYDQTQRILDQAREALIGFAAANGYFPCPASALANNGQEAPGTNHAAIAPIGTCPNTVLGSNMYHGFLPAAALGFTPTDDRGYAVDAWGLTQNRIRYAVSNVTVNLVTQPFTRVNGMRNAGMSKISSCIESDSIPVCTLPIIGTAAKGLIFLCNSGTGVAPGTNCGTAGKLSDNAIVVIWSVGPNAATTGGASVDEAQNPNPVGGSPDRIFVSKTKSAVAGSEFDDIVTWIGPPMIFNRLIAAGQLP